MARLTGHDIRMADFGRTRFRGGYRRADVDDYLLVLARVIDRYRSELAEVNAALDQALVDTSPPSPGDTGAPTDSSYLMLDQARRVADDTIRDAQRQADGIVARAQHSATELHFKAREARESTINDARAVADQQLRDASRRAATLVQEARERAERSTRLEAEAELKLARAEQRMAERAQALAAEARRVEELAGWLAELDLRPDTEPGGYGPTNVDEPSDHDQDVVEFRRAD